MDKTSYLVLQAKQGDKTAFGELYSDYSGAIYGLIIKMTRQPELSNDILQDVFVKAWQKIDTYDENKGRFYTWLYRIARNTTINKLRRANKENYTDDIGVYEKQLEKERMDIDTLDLRGKVSELDQKYKQVVDLIYFQGYTHQQVHEQYNIPLGTVKTRLRRAIHLLGEIYKNDGILNLFILSIACIYG